MNNDNRQMKNGMMGLVTGDALGLPVQFEPRAARINDPVTGMRGNGAFDVPAGTWSDDSSLALAALYAVYANRTSSDSRTVIDYNEIMSAFSAWLSQGKFTPDGYAFDIGGTTMSAIRRYDAGETPPVECGDAGEHENGNGALMRILPLCILCVLENREDAETVIRSAASLTHRHPRNLVGCSLFYHIVSAVMTAAGSLQEQLQLGIDSGRAANSREPELKHYDRLIDLHEFMKTPNAQISSSGYVVHTLEAAVWCLLNTVSFEDCLLKAVNLGYDTDTTAAVAGGLAGLHYGYDAIPQEWLAVIRRREWIESLCMQD